MSGISNSLKSLSRPASTSRAKSIGRSRSGKTTSCAAYSATWRMGTSSIRFWLLPVPMGISSLP